MSHTEGDRRAVRGPDPANREAGRPGCGFVLGGDGKTVIGRFPSFEDAVLDAGAPELLRVLEHIERHSMDSLTTGEQKMVSDAIAKARWQ